MICEHQKVADLVSTFEMTTEEINEMEENFRQKENPDTNSTNTKNSKETSKPKTNGAYKYVDNQPEIEEINQTPIDKVDVEEEYLENDYYLLEKPCTLISRTLISVKNSFEVTDHILVCGIHPSMYYFILPLRAKYLNRIQHIVILNPERPNNNLWQSINIFPNIVFIKGSPKSEEDLIRANISYADKVVILNDIVYSEGKNKFSLKN